MPSPSETTAPWDERSWNQARGWSAWLDLGFAIYPDPAMLYDPLSVDVEVYALGRDSAVVERYRSPVSGWSKWIDLGGRFTWL